MHDHRKKSKDSNSRKNRIASNDSNNAKQKVIMNSDTDGNDSNEFGSLVPGEGGDQKQTAF